MDDAERARLIDLAEAQACREVSAELGTDWLDEMYRECRNGSDAKYDHMNDLIAMREGHLLQEWGVLP